jgi:hypothetical protein
MPRMRFDGVIEAVHYTPGGQITLVRAYERRGAVWSDSVLLGRNELVGRLKQGKRFVTGQRKSYLGSNFQIGLPVRYLQGSVVTDRQASERDHLAEVPIF